MVCTTAMAMLIPFMIMAADTDTEALRDTTEAVLL